MKRMNKAQEHLQARGGNMILQRGSSFSADAMHHRAGLFYITAVSRALYMLRLLAYSAYPEIQMAHHVYQQSCQVVLIADVDVIGSQYTNRHASYSKASMIP